MVIFHSHQLLPWSWTVDADYEKIYPNASESCSLGQAKKKKKPIEEFSFFSPKISRMINTSFVLQFNSV